MPSGFKVGAAVGSGIVARAAEAGGADFLIAISAGRMRNMGLPSIACMLPICDSADATLPFAEREVLPQAKVPVYVGVSVWSMGQESDRVISGILGMGFAGITNFPSAMHFSVGMRRVLDLAGLGLRAEIGMLRKARAKGGRSIFYCGTKEDARLAAEAGLDAVVLNFGWNLGGADSHTADISLDEAANRARQVIRLVRRLRPEMEVYLEGGPIVTADDLGFVVRHAKASGYVGGSTIDRFPVQHSVSNQIAEYRSASETPGRRTPEMREAAAELCRHGVVGQSDAHARFATALVRAREGRGHIYLVTQPGGDTSAALSMLMRRAGRHASVVTLDLGQVGSAHQANSLIFGHERNAPGKSGLLQSMADFAVLQNCQAMPEFVRRKILGAMRSNTFQRIGSRTPHPLRSRLIFTSDEDAPGDWGDAPLSQLVYPSLRARHGDVRPLFEQALETFTSDRRFPDIRPAAFRVLAAHGWPGNEAELRNVAAKFVALPELRVFEAHDMLLLLQGATPKDDRTTAEKAERQLVLRTLTSHGFHKGSTAKALNISRKTLYNRMKRLRLS